MTNATLLIADGDAFQQQLIDMLLAVDHYTLVPVKTGLEALTYLRDNTPELAILANNLPDMKGTDLCARLKKFSRFQDVPVVLISADMQHKTTKELATAVKADLVLARPLGDKGLRGHVAELLEKAAARRALKGGPTAYRILTPEEKLAAKPDLDISGLDLGGSEQDTPQLSGKAAKPGSFKSLADDGIDEDDLLAEMHEPKRQLEVEADMKIIGLGESYQRSENRLLTHKPIRPVDAFANYEDLPKLRDDVLKPLETEGLAAFMTNGDTPPAKPKVSKPTLPELNAPEPSVPKPSVPKSSPHSVSAEKDVPAREASQPISLEISADELVARGGAGEAQKDLKATVAKAGAAALGEASLSDASADLDAVPASRPPVKRTEQAATEQVVPELKLEPEETEATSLNLDQPDLDQPDLAEPEPSEKVFMSDAALEATAQTSTPLKSRGPEAVPFKVADPRPEPHAAELELLRTQVDDLLNENEQLKGALEELESGKPMMATFSYLDAIEELETLRRLTEHQAKQLSRVHQENRRLRAEMDEQNVAPKLGIWERLKL